MYDVMLFLHILAAIVWIGGAVLINTLVSRLIRLRDPGGLALVSRQTEWLSTRLFVPATLVLLLMGILMVVRNEAIEFTQLWIILALILFVVTFLTGSLFFGPESGRISRLAEERGGDDPEFQRRLRRITVLARLDLLVLLVILGLMVWKPGL